MNRDLTLIKLMMTKSNLNSYGDQLPDSLCKETEVILNDLAEYYKLFPAKSEADGEFIEWFHHISHSDYTKKQHEQYDILFNNLNLLDGSPLVDEFVSKLQEQDILHKIKDIDDVTQVSELLSQYEKNKQKSKYNFIDLTNLDEMLIQTDPAGGYKWRLHELNTTLGTLSGGTFGVVAARPNSGKTSFLASEMTYIAQQLAESAVILWLNNENKGIRIGPRLYAALCNATRSELDTNREKAKSVFNEKIGSKIQIVDIQGWNYKQIEKIVRDLKPEVVLIDMLDNVRGPKGSSEDSCDIKYERLYQWALELSCAQDCAIIATSQMNVNGEGKQYPDMTVLKGSQGSAKQGAASWILMIGRDNENYKSRFLSAPKSKFGNDQMRSEVIFDAERSLFLSEESKFRLFS